MNHEKTPRLLLSLVVALSVIAIVSGLMMTGGPFYQRQLKMDQLRSSDLRMLKNHITEYYRHNKALPSSLELLKKDLASQMNASYNPQIFYDPVTEVPYQYQKLSDEKFSLCAHFEVDTRQGSKGRRSAQRMSYYSPDEAAERHPKGLRCYTLQRLNEPSSKLPEFEWFESP